MLKTYLFDDIIEKYICSYRLTCIPNRLSFHQSFTDFRRSFHQFSTVIYQPYLAHRVYQLATTVFSYHPQIALGRGIAQFRPVFGSVPNE